MTESDDTAFADWINALDSGVRERARMYLGGLLAKKTDSVALFPEEAELRHGLKRSLKDLPHDADPPIPLPVIGMVGAFAAFVSFRFGLFAFLAVIVLACAVGFWSYAAGVNRALANDVARKKVRDAALPDALQIGAKNRVETAYCDAALALLPAKNNLLPPEMRREQMRSLATLLESGERLDTVRAEITSALASATPESLRLEEAALKARADRAADPDTRAALEQSRVFVSDRLRRAETLSRLTDRIDAESELVYQAFRSAQSSIASLRVSPAVAGFDTSATGEVAGTGAARDLADTIRRQTQAVEAAVQELGVRL